MKFKFLTAPIYKNLLASKVLNIGILEEKATCDSCLMSRTPTPKKDRYQAHLKCCTFYPFMPNFAVGAILSDSSENFGYGKKVIKEIIAKNQFALPIGLVAPAKYQYEFKKREANDFGNREDWLCPYLNKEKNCCSVWAYRGAVCTSFYCRSSYGSRGKKFWAQVSDYLTYVEMALMEEALIRMDFSPRQISENLIYINQDLNELSKKSEFYLNPMTAKKLWRDYYADREAFYIKSFEIVKSFDRKAFIEMLGEQGLNLEEKMIQVSEGLVQS